MMQLKLRSTRFGEHIHVNMFMRDGEGDFVGVGKVILNEPEYQAFRNTLAQGADAHKLLKFSEECDLSGKNEA